MNFIKSFPKFRVSTKKVIISRVIILLLMAANLSFIWINSAKIADDSTKTSEYITKSVAPYVIEKFDKLTENEKTQEVVKLNPIIRNVAHSIEYIPLGILLFLLMLSVFDINRDIKKSAVLALSLLSIALALMFALSDEIHQIFVDGRSFEVKDIALDMLGMFIGYVGLALPFSIREYKK